MGAHLLGSLIAVVIACLGIIAWSRKKKALAPSVAVSTPQESPSRYVLLRKFLPDALYAASCLCLLFALADPYIFTDQLLEKTPPSSEGKPPPVEGIAIYLVLDQSGSMEGEVLNKDENGRRYQTTKLKLLKSITEKFVLGDKGNMHGRPDDLIGLVGFSRGAQVISPLTLDHNELVKRLRNFDIMRVQNQDGTSIGYAIYKTTNLIVATRHFAEELIQEGKPAYTIQSYVIILVTDGVQETNPLDKGKKWRTMPIEDAAQYAADNGVRLYIINVEPDFSAPKYALLRKQLQHDTAVTGGKFFLAGGEQTLAEIYKEIEGLEKSALPAPQKSFLDEGVDVPQKHTQRKYYLSHWLLVLSVIFLTLAVGTDSLWRRRVP